MSEIKDIKPSLIKKIVIDITDELYSRRGFRQVWDDLDSEIEKEIEKKLFDIIKTRLNSVK